MHSSELYADPPWVPEDTVRMELDKGNGRWEITLRKIFKKMIKPPGPPETTEMVKVRTMLLKGVYCLGGLPAD